jgi:GNAT superfamily N-acetyltransferase
MMVAKQAEFWVSPLLEEMDIPMIIRFLSEESYWAKGVPAEVVERSLRHSLCFAVLVGEGDNPRQVAFARVVTDQATFAYMADVFVLPEYRGRGYSKHLIQHIVAVPELQGLRRWMLGTLDAHGLYQQVGFGSLAHPERMMEIVRPYLSQPLL